MTDVPAGVSANTVPVSSCVYLFSSSVTFSTLITNLDGNNTVYYGFGNGLTAGDITHTAPLAPGGSVAIQGDVGDVYAVSPAGQTIDVAVVPGGTFFTVPPSVFKAGNTVIITPQGFFLFNGPPGPGKLIGSFTITGGTIFGNTYEAFLTVYQPGGGQTQLAPGGVFFDPLTALSQGSVASGANELVFTSEVDTPGFSAGQFFLQSGTTPQLLVNILAALAAVTCTTLSASGLITATSGILIPAVSTAIQFKSGAVFEHLIEEVLSGGNAYLFFPYGSTGVGPFIDNGGILRATHPGSPGVPETDQIPALGTGWATGSATAGFQAIRYWLGTDGQVHVEGIVHSTSATPAATLWTFGTGYQPTNAQRIPITINNNAGAILAGVLSISTAGVVTIPLPAITAASEDIYIDGEFRLN